MFFSSLKEYEGMKPGLSRIRKFLNAVGNPQDKLKCVHIAGTNGKGSTAAFIASALKENGYKTGLYTSPHLIDITERIKIDGNDISDREFNALSDKYLGLAKKCRLSYFEYLTAIAFIYFENEKIDIAVLETGLGGRFDATNVIEKPLACVITSIAMDHQEILGHTIEQIAFEKAGIIKKNAPLVCGKLPAKAAAVIKEKAKPLVFGRDFKAGNIRCDFKKQKQTFDFTACGRTLKDIKIGLLGDYQIQNASTALYVLELLRKKGYSLAEKAVRKGFEETKWPARFDLRKIKRGAKKFELVIDGSHNEQGIDAFLSLWKQTPLASKKRTLIFAAMKEKNYKAVIKKVSAVADKVILPDIQNDRAVSTETLKNEFKKYIPEDKIIYADSAVQALGLIKNNEKAAATGSLYLAGKILKAVNN